MCVLAPVVLYSFAFLKCLILRYRQKYKPEQKLYFFFYLDPFLLTSSL